MKIFRNRHDNPRIFFMHIPKSGGTSVDYAMRKNYQNSFRRIEASASYKASEIVNSHMHWEENYNACFRYREGLLVYEMVRGVRYISGHILYDQKIWYLFKDKYNYISLLRHPVERYVSNYFYNRYKDSEHCRLETSISSFLESDLGRSWGHEFIKFFSGSQTKSDDLPEVKLNVAKENALKFNTIGFLDSLESFVAECKSKYGLKLNIPHKRKNPKGNYGLSKAEFDRIAHVCRFDIELYDFIRSSSCKVY
ncbi:hypothetical protein C1752_04448 [Acaryochloris thomasi RCC1774]|uniref:Sulfotransferase family protein n=1 Tax=Acaryochloris thomasi RCC1774 TaxID=1764569 RepID=A0A2W1JD63_9CYAN|nr:sulfotransferase family 2 domain-containing protein [Acaryochloris thomasi]PZD71799.1 hypothetical protein C1752_04448 [Acaryochloris thomasi RCC1774]